MNDQKLSMQEARDVDEHQAGRAVLGPKVVLKGEVFVQGSLTIQGEIDGNVIGAEHVLITRGARVRGRVCADRIQFENGTNLDAVVLTGRITTSG